MPRAVSKDVSGGYAPESFCDRRFAGETPLLRHISL
jgi:hypothetical protein